MQSTGWISTAVFSVCLGLAGAAHGAAPTLPSPINSVAAVAVAVGSAGTGGSEYESGSGSLAAATGSSNVPNQLPFSVAASASVSEAPQPTLKASVSGYADPAWQGALGFGFRPAASALSTYYFEVVGPADISVPVIAQSTIDVTASPGSDLSLGGYVLMTGASGSGLFDMCPTPEGYISNCYIDEIPSSSLKFNQTIDFAANAPVEVDMAAGALFSYLSPTTESAQVTVDPMFTIDPTFLAANPGYLLDFSSGVGNLPVPGVPEPNTWAEMVLGVGVVGGSLRFMRRNKAANLATA